MTLSLRLTGTFVFTVFVAAMFFIARPVEAADRTWDGGGSTNNWSEDANWSTDTEPTSSDVAIFDGTSTKNATIDVNVSVGGVDINSGYSGTITQGSAKTLTVGTSDFDISAGTFTGSNANITMQDAITISGGTFSSTSANLQVAGAFTVSSGTFNEGSGTVTANNTAAAWNVATSETFNNLTINKSHNQALIVTSGDTLVVNGTFTLTNGGLDTGVVDAQGNVSQASTFDGGTGIIDFGNNGANQTYTVNGGETPTVRFDHSSDASDTLAFAAAATLTNMTITSGFSGTLPMTNSGNHTLTVLSWNQAAGTYDASAQSSWILRAFTRSGGSFTAPDLVTVTGASGSTWDVDTSQTFENFTVNKTHNNILTIASGDTFVIAGDLNLTDGKINGGILDTRSDITQSADFDGGTTTIDFGDDTVNQTYTINGGTAPAIELDSPDDANDEILFTAPATVTQLSATIGFGSSDTVPVLNPSDYELTFITIHIVNGDIEADAQSEWNIQTFICEEFCDFSAPTLVTFVGGAGTWDTFDTVLLNNVTVAKDANTVLTVASGDVLHANDEIVLSNGKVSGGNIEAEDDVTVGVSYDGGTSTLRFTGSNHQDFVLDSGAEALYDGDIYVNKPDPEDPVVLSVSDALVMNANNQDFVIEEGAFYTGGGGLTISGTGGELIVEDGGELRFQDPVAVMDFNSGQPQFETGSTAVYEEGGSVVSPSVIRDFGVPYYHLVIDSDDYFELAANLEVNGDLAILDGALDASAGNYTINVAGDWLNNDTFVAQNGAVILDGTNQTISGNTTFYNLTKTVTSAATLTLEAGATQVIDGALTLEGASGQLLSVRSSTSSTATSIDINGSQSLEYLNVQDNTAIGTTAACSTGCVDNGNNTNWTF